MGQQRIKLVASLLSLAFLVTCATPEGHTREPRRSTLVLQRAALRPVIIGRGTWRADNSAVRQKPLYSRSVKAVFVHHTDNPNHYDCKADVPAMLLAMEEAHLALGWDDLGYNFVVDRCGTIYEGRAGGVDRAVRGAHTEGFNANSVGIAALGTFGKGEKVPRPMLEAIASIAAWKLDPGIDPLGRVRLVSTNSKSRYPKGTSVKVNVISGHRDVFETTCPGDALYDALPWVRQAAAQLRNKAVRAG
ncbi:MAG TPA: N-acetylmuramoyl-L-alanine amidase [Streptomyces sp.]